jgi:succinate dehydrogenase hydrophobic anchor subunit
VLWFVAFFATKEVAQAYADAMAPLQNTIWLVVAWAAIVIASECGLCKVKKLIK